MRREKKGHRDERKDEIRDEWKSRERKWGEKEERNTCFLTFKRHYST